MLDLYAIAGQDRADCLALLRDGVDEAAVADVLARLRAALGTFPAGRPGWQAEEHVALVAFLRFAPEVLAWHAEHGVEPEVTRATLADVGRHLALHRRETGSFGLSTWWWLCLHMAGGLFALGRLQHQVHRQPHELPGAVAAGEWVVGLHVPETGPLTPEAVDDSLRRVRPFLDRHLPGLDVRTATCTSWLLDPYLREHLPPTSHIGAFARRFTLVGEPEDAPDSALFFTFRTRDTKRLDRLPRSTSLQRVVLDRMEAGGTWQQATGVLRLPGTFER